jgi:hypothetical protein
LATGVTGRCVATRAVLTTDTEQLETAEQQHQDDDDDPQRFHPAWRAGIEGRFSHVRLLSSCVVVKVIVAVKEHKDSMTIQKQYVYTKSIVNRPCRRRILV